MVIATQTHWGISHCLGLSFLSNPGKRQPEEYLGQTLGTDASMSAVGLVLSKCASLALGCLQLLANAVILLGGNFTGAFHKHQLQDASRDLFIYTVKCIQIRRKLRVEKRQQVGTPFFLSPLLLCTLTLTALHWAACHSCGPCGWSLANLFPGSFGVRESRVMGVTALSGCDPGENRISAGADFVASMMWQAWGLMMWQAWGLRLLCLSLRVLLLSALLCQENLLLSVLPAHISMGMKLAIIERLKEGSDHRYMPDNNFHSLYVKRHQNVRWAGPGKCTGLVSENSDTTTLVLGSVGGFSLYKDWPSGPSLGLGFSLFLQGEDAIKTIKGLGW